MTVGDTIRTWREALGLSREELAEKSEAGLSQVRRIEEGTTRTPRQITLRKLAKALGKSVEDAHRLHAEAKRDAAVAMSVAFVHGLPAAPLILLLLDNVRHGVRLASYGTVRENDELDPVWYSPGELIREARPPAPGVRAFTGKELLALLQDEEVDCIVAASEVYQHKREEVLVCAHVVHGVAGHNVLMVRRRPNSGRKSLESRPRLQRSPIEDLNSFLPLKEKSEPIRLLYPTGTACENFVAILKGQLGLPIHEQGFSLSRFEEVDGLLTDRPTFVLAWEPFVTWIWEAIVNEYEVIEIPYYQLLARYGAPPPNISIDIVFKKKSRALRTWAKSKTCLAFLHALDEKVRQLRTPNGQLPSVTEAIADYLRCSEDPQVSKERCRLGMLETEYDFGIALEWYSQMIRPKRNPLI